MNKLDTKTRKLIIRCLVEGQSIRATARTVEVSKNTVAKLLIEAGAACQAYHDTHVRNLDSRRVQCDEIWSFCYSKQKNVASAKAAPADAGDTWTWTAIDADSKLAVSWLVGGRDAGYATEFMNDVAERLANRVQLTTDGHRAYLEAVEGAFRCGRRLCPVDQALRCGIRRREALQPGRLHRYSSQHGNRQSRRGPYLHQLRGAPESHHADVHAPVHAAHQRFFKEGRKPCPRRCASLHALQLLPDSPNPTSYPGDGSWRYGSVVGHIGYRGVDRSAGGEPGPGAWPVQEKDFKLTHYPKPIRVDSYMKRHIKCSVNGGTEPFLIWARVLTWTYMEVTNG